MYSNCCITHLAVGDSECLGDNFIHEHHRKSDRSDGLPCLDAQSCRGKEMQRRKRPRAPVHSDIILASTTMLEVWGKGDFTKVPHVEDLIGSDGISRILRAQPDCSLTAVGFEPTPLRTGALSQRLRPLGQFALGIQAAAVPRGRPLRETLCTPGGSRRRLW